MIMHCIVVHLLVSLNMCCTGVGATVQVLVSQCRHLCYRTSVGVTVQLL